MKQKLNSRLSAALALATLVAIPCVRVDAQNAPKTSLVIAGVTDGVSGAPLANAEVSLSDLNISARTDWSGEARIPNISPGKHKFEIRMAGYAPLDVDLLVQGDSTGPVFRLAKVGTTLEPVKVAGNPSSSYLAGFEARRAQGRGRYLTTADLEKNQNRSLVAVLAQSFGSLMSIPDKERAGHNILMTRRTKPRLMNVDVHCGVDVYLDNSPYVDDIDALHPSDLAGVEYYPIESAPGEFRKLSDNCGVVVLWTKK
ncbi:MAG TPA: carboxypeptidase regulatory-like domain-containing protein [Gemmatimonadaceae bacterium]